MIEKPILELPAVDRETELEMAADGHRLVIEPVRERTARVRESAKRVVDAHDETLRKLSR